MRIKVKDIMTTEVVTVSGDTPFKDVAETLLTHRVSAVPVVDEENRLVGIVSEADLLRKEEFREHYADEGYRQPWRVRLRHRLAPEGAHPADKADARTAADLMTAPAYVVHPESSVSTAARLLDEYGVKRLVVATENGPVAGIFSRSDLLKAFVRGDAELAEEVRQDVLRRSLWVDTDGVAVRVDHGVVTLSGVIPRRSDAELAVNLTHRINGVVDVIGELEWKEDDSR
ncbi:CBS domain-containing protein [Acrocarpospora catenulata]|uniref:CBS domain-containing protein n=1 Tax=Acrocarpospora catenulata TaxID=2836182 RepID=UPI001BD956EB|nr:CBS domain-containing protein [Acrocarpospora catenulata]